MTSTAKSVSHPAQAQIVDDVIEIVFFGEELTLRAPSVAGCLYCRKGQRWMNMADITLTIQRKLPFFIRPATEAEMSRLEDLVVLYEENRMGRDTIKQIIAPDSPEFFLAEKAASPSMSESSFVFPVSADAKRVLQ